MDSGRLDAEVVLNGKWILERELGAGGMGRVFRARHATTNRIVAVKVINTALARDGSVVRRFAREARTASSLKSKHVVAVIEVDELPSGLPYIVMEHLEGKDLGRIHDERGTLSLGVGDVVRWALEACDGIADAHRAGIVHRDLKPENLFLADQPDGPPIVKVLDFGLAKALPGSAASAATSFATTAGNVLGTPFFMSPEQIRALPTIDHRTDIWSLGATLFDLLAGRPPHVASNLHVLRARILREDVGPIQRVRADVPPALGDIIARCLRREPSDRFASIDDVANALARSGLATPASGVTTPAVYAATEQIFPEASDTIDDGATAIDRPESGPTTRRFT